ncbi:FAD-binding oxidoreductase [Georgenia thermotolerans]|uniref:FAD-binding protein n=1 Tax=Georgenia thermotolerans TaxID=527326 RepID=A0A7J5UNS0_9MICO|nr:FAD-binding oxidoreductase [Georgenia thermotolerans]KAE8763881.1 FAD-binding protein [Georgenia thermotolerans]
MNGVTHQKWWGWGVEGVAFHHEDKPKLAPFVLDKVGIDLHAPGTPPPAFDDIAVPATRLGDELATTLRRAVGEDYLVTDDLDRVVHTYGKGLADLVKIRAGHLPRVPDVVVYPGDEDEVRAVVDAVVAADAVLIPFGGGSNISGSLTPPADEERVVVSLDLGRMNRVLEVDEAAGLARVQAGVLGPDLEDQLGARGWTMGHQPDSFRHSTLGGWIATRSSGMQSDKYGDIADITRGLRMVQPGKVVVLRPLPSTSSGPSVREMILGSEGRLGVITEAWVNVHRLPENREIIAYLFPTWAAGLAAMAEIAASDAAPSVTRVSDANETQFSLATQKKSRGIKGKVSKALFAVLERRGWDLEQACLSYIGYEGGKERVAREKAIVGKIVKAHGGIKLGTGPGALYDQKKFDTPYIRDFLLDVGGLADVSETAMPWSRLMDVYSGTVRAAREAFDRLGVKGFIMCHLSHSYHSGACLYFTFAFPPGTDDVEEQLARYWEVKSAVQQSFVDTGATISHHHGVGTDHAHWLEEDISEAGTDVMVALLRGVDPGRNLNPGTLIPAQREW